MSGGGQDHNKPEGMKMQSSSVGSEDEERAPRLDQQD